MTTQASINTLGVVGLILHADGTLRLFMDSNGRMAAEVIGFRTDRSRAFLGELGQLEDIGCEILVCDEPKTYGWGEVHRKLHYRRAESRPAAGAGTGARRAHPAREPRV
jgi:hypothetical protein